MEKELQSKVISFLRFPLTVGVVFIHFNLTNRPVGGVVLDINDKGWLYWIITYCSDVLPRISVPLFFLISGFLFFYNAEFDKGIYISKLKKRVHTLLVPYITWNIIALAYLYIRCTIVKESFMVDVSLERIFNTFFWYDGNNGLIIRHTASVIEMPAPICGVLWYVREIMLMAIMAPLLFWIIKKMRAWCVVFLGVVWVFDSLLFPSSMHYFLSALFFYSWGAYISINKLNMVTLFRKMKYLPVLYLILSIIDVFTKELRYSFLIHSIGAIIGLISVVIIAAYFVERNKVKVNYNLANSSFFIYVLHSFILIPIGIIWLRCFSAIESEIGIAGFYFFVPCFVAFLSFSLYMVLKKYLNGLCKVLTGGR